MLNRIRTLSAAPRARWGWLAVRLYLASIWLRFGAGKISDGWLTENPMGDMLVAIAAGDTGALLAPYQRFAQLLLDLGLDRTMSTTLPFVELTIGFALLTGVLVAPVAAAAILLNLNFIVSGIATVGYDGHVIALQLTLVLAGSAAAGRIGVLPLLRRAAASASSPLSSPAPRPIPRPLMPLTPSRAHEAISLGA